MPRKRLYRTTDDKMLAGVCGGVAEYFNLDPSIVRILWVFLGLGLGGTGLFAYIVAWIIVPEKDEQPKYLD